jgi:hypothetical protein
MFVSVILHIDLCLTFYNYNWVFFLFNLTYFNNLFNLLTSNIHNFLTVALIQAILALTRS